MKIPVPLPPLGEAIESATISQWLKSLGDPVAEGDALVEVSTDKVDTEILSPLAGVLVEICIGDDVDAAIGTVIAIIDDGATEQPKSPAVDGTGVSDVPEVVPRAEPAPETVSSSPNDSMRERPELEGSGSGCPTSKSANLRGTTQNLTRLRKTIAHRMLASLQTSAQLTTIVEVDITELGRLRRRYNTELSSGNDAKLSYLAFIAFAALEALRTYPQVNSSVDLAAGTVTYPAAEHLGIAVDTEKGLFVPVIRDAGRMSIPELATRIADVAERTRASTISVDELSGGTFTITNTGSRGALMDTPIINQPQVAILGAGLVARRPVVAGREGEDESIAIRSMVYLSLTYDHRIVDGADAARYLLAVKNRLEGADFDVDGALPTVGGQSS